MLPVPSGVHVWLAPGHTDMRKGFPGLSLLVQETLAKDPHSGHLFVFRGKRGDLVKIIWHDGQGACLFSKRLERGKFISYDLCQAPEHGPLFAEQFSSAISIIIKTIRNGQGAKLCRRSLKLLFEGWIPHDDGASKGCLVLAANISLLACSK